MPARSMLFMAHSSMQYWLSPGMVSTCQLSIKRPYTAQTQGQDPRMKGSQGVKLSHPNLTMVVLSIYIPFLLLYPFLVHSCCSTTSFQASLQPSFKERAQWISSSGKVQLYNVLHACKCNALWCQARPAFRATSRRGILCVCELESQICLAFALLCCKVLRHVMILPTYTLSLPKWEELWSQLLKPILMSCIWLLTVGWLTCSWYSHDYSQMAVHSVTADSRRRVEEVAKRLQSERNRRANGSTPGSLTDPHAAFWQSLDVERVPENCLAMLICQALVPTTTATKVCEYTSKCRVSRDDYATWGSSDKVVPLMMIHYSVTSS